MADPSTRPRREGCSFAHHPSPPGDWLRRGAG